ncbi:pyridoxamine 5'-phosphate oxidase family protein [Desulfovibrio sp. JC010]|uniref:pyridoxamine 5'-phosphate oxidase family protein n=1 Tax=Desulfovibrio sp. JC010 TaxID=2593641 RepID=UPI0013D4235B|nr:pyridoxamine 5'-phosphate oxidase family protein [Desulfovibrio sp. JC010]NDV26488.1 pyridoxamine 5'-phosphate oxidase family protein [Desulfovibrio sp. JC010]
MQSDISWNEVENLFSRVQYVSLGTVDRDGYPRISPIGSVSFTGPGRGYYFEKFPKTMRENIERDPRMILMAAESGAGFWIKSLWKGRFPSQPALRLVCRTGERRKATQSEIDDFLGKVSMYRFFKGHDLLWKDMNMVREFEVLRIEGLEAGRMNP